MNHQKEKESNPIYNCIKKNKIPGNKVNQGGERPAHWKLEDIEKHTNKWKDSLFSRNGTINSVKTSMLPKAVDTVNAIPPKIPWYFPPKQSKSS